MHVITIAFIFFAVSAQIFICAAEKSMSFAATTATIIPLDQKSHACQFIIEEKTQAPLFAALCFDGNFYGARLGFGYHPTQHELYGIMVHSFSGWDRKSNRFNIIGPFTWPDTPNNHQTVIINIPNYNSEIVAFNSKPHVRMFPKNIEKEIPEHLKDLAQYDGGPLPNEQLSPDFVSIQNKLNLETTPRQENLSSHIYAVDPSNRRVLTGIIPTYCNTEKAHLYVYSFDDNHDVIQKEIPNITDDGWYNFPKKAWLTPQNTIVAFYKHKKNTHCASLFSIDIETNKKTHLLLLDAHTLIKCQIEKKTIANDDPISQAMIYNDPVFQEYDQKTTNFFVCRILPRLSTGDFGSM